jgi:hypothetical protein
VEDGFSYITEIQDRMTEPAQKEIRALKSLEAEVKLADKAIRDLQKQQLKYREQGMKGLSSQVGLEIAKVKRHLTGLKSEVAEQGEGGFLSQLGEHLSLAKGVTPALLLADAIEKVGAVAFEAAKEVGKLVLEAADMKEGAVLAYGGGEEGERVFKQINDLANAVHIPAEKAHKLAGDLMLRGIESTDAIASVVQAQAALIRTHQEGGADKLESIVERSLSAGHFEVGKGFGKGKLSALGISEADLIRELQTKLGGSTEAIKAELKNGKIAAEVGIQAISDAISHGKIGQAATSKFGFEELQADVGNFFTGIAEDINTEPLKQGFVDVMAVLQDNKPEIKEFFELVVKGSADALEAVAIFVLETEGELYELAAAFAPVIKAIEAVTNAAREGAAIHAQEGGSGGGGSEGAAVGTEGLTGAFDITQGVDAKRLGGLGPDTKAAPVQEMPANAEGGQVLPAHGEMFASVAPGETIMPANDNGGRQVHVDVGGVHVHVSGGANAHEMVAQLRPLLEAEIADVFDRAANEMGQ